MKITVSKAKELKMLPDESCLGFGTILTDHMFKMDYDEDNGWHNPRIEPYGPIQMDPANLTLHYSQTIFEGLKAYRTESGDIQLFRPADNFERLSRSAQGLCIPPFDKEFALEALKELLTLDKRWVPSVPGTSLYVRPIIIAMDPYLGLKAGSTYLFYIILSPVGAYYAEGFNPVKIMATKDYVRAVRGGVGMYKTGGNYAASLNATVEANRQGYTQVLWLDGVEQKYVEEVGSMNIFFVIDGTIVTPMLNGSILPGITRDTVMALAKEWGLPAVERRIAIDEVFEAAESGKLDEVFGSGTAAVISPVGEIKFGEKVITINNGEVGPMAQRFMDSITDIQYGRKPDPKNWIVPV